MEAAGPSPCSQQPDTCPDREQNEYSPRPRPQAYFFMFHFNIILSSNSCYSKRPFFFLDSKTQPAQ